MTSTNTLSFRRRVINAGAWVLGGHVLSQGIRLASNLIMTRLLLPEMFGVMSIATVIMVGLSLFSDLGLRQSVIQSKRGDDASFLNTVWSLQIVRGILLWLMASLISLGLFYAGRFGWLPENTVYAEPLLPLVIAVVSFSAVIAGFESTRMATASRNLAQGQLTRIEIASQISGILLMVLWAWVDRSIWALVSGWIMTSIVRTAGSHAYMPGVRNHWQWDKEALGEILNFGLWVLAASILGFMMNNGDRLLLGGLVDAKMLGIYTIAYFISSSLIQVVAKLSGSVTFPVLSEIVRSAPERLLETYYRFRLPLDILLLFLAGLFFAAGRYVIFAFYDERYAAAGQMLEILSLTMVSYRYNLVDQCYLALGRPYILSLLIVIRAAILFVLLPIAYAKFQMDGALWAIVFSTFSSVPLTFYYKWKFSILDVRKELLTLPVFVVGWLIGLLFRSLVQ